MASCYVGIDLSGSPSRFTGIAILNRRGRLVHLSLTTASVSMLSSIVYGLCKRGGIVAIDSPLNVPSDKRGFREVDRELIRLGYKVLPLGSQGMQKLIGRANRLYSLLRKYGFQVIETHPRSSIEMAGCNYSEWHKCIAEYVSLPKWCFSLSSRDAVDAIISATVAFLHGREHPIDFEIRAPDGVIHLLPPES